MNTQDIERIESELSLKLPEFYTDVMLSYPFPGWDCENFMLCNDPEEIIRENKENRKEGFFDAEWPDHFFILGFDGCGNYYFIDLKNKKEKVYFADHESFFDSNSPDKLEETYDGMESYFSLIRETEEDIKIANEEPLEPLPSKKGWQFWK